MRIAFVIVPDFVIRAHGVEGGPLFRLDAQLLSKVVLVEGDGGRATVRAACPELRGLGIRAGMTAARARSAAGHVCVLAYEPRRVERESSRVAGALLSASPQVHVLGDGVFWVGADGCRFLGGEAALMERLDRCVREAGHAAPKLGLADSVIAARAAAIHDLGVVPSGGDNEALLPLPLSALPLEESSRAALWSLGIRTIGAFTALPARQISARFGADAVEAHRLARGEDRRTVPVLSVAESPTIEVDFEAPHAVAEPALFVIQGGLDRLLAPHRARGFGVSRLKIELSLIEGHWERELRPADPVNDTRRLFEMCRALLQDAELPSQMEGLRVSVVEVGPAKARQEGLWENRRKRTMSLESMLLRLQGRLGANAVLTPGPTKDAHLPDQAAGWTVCQPPFTVRRPPQGGGSRVVPMAAWRLKRLASRIDLQSDAGMPVRAEWEGRWESIARVAGPQRIETGWFETSTTRGGDDFAPHTPIRRDYWYAELDSGVGLSLFRDRGNGHWFVQGVLD